MKDLIKIGSWIINSFFVGMGVYLAFTLIEVVFDTLDSLENITLRILFFTVIGGVFTVIFKALNKNES